MKRRRKTPFSFKFLIHQLFGLKDKNRIGKEITVSETKRYYLKILDATQLAINETITIADKNQKEELNQLVINGRESIKNLKSFVDIDHQFIEIQTNIVFQLIGISPHRFFVKNVPVNKKHWILSDHRQIQYVQDEKQKGMLLNSLMQSKYSYLFKDTNEYLNFLMQECIGDYGVLRDWLKKNHPEVYCEIF